MVHANSAGTMSKVPPGPGRPKGAINKITRDIRAVIRDLAEGNAHRVQEWFDRVAETDPAEAARLWLVLLRFVTPTLQAAAIADLTPPHSMKDMQKRLCEFTDDQLMQIIANNREGKAVLRQRESVPLPGTDDEDLLR
jgi:hypothetical protein